MGKIIVLEGPDGAGKTTQYEKASATLEKNGTNFRRLKFPRYDTPTGQAIRLYLDGAFGKTPGDVNAYAASSFYAADRYASFKSEWEQYYNEPDSLMFFDRYTSSNAIHQGAKLPPNERKSFFSWLEHYEYELLRLPKPELVMWLDVAPELSMANAMRRGARDLHEKDAEYVRLCYETMKDAAEFYGWSRINCTAKSDGMEKMRAPDDIAADIYAVMRAFIR